MACGAWDHLFVRKWRALRFILTPTSAGHTSFPEKSSRFRSNTAVHALEDEADALETLHLPVRMPESAPAARMI